MKVSKDGRIATHLGGNNHIMLTRASSFNSTSIYWFKII